MTATVAVTPAALAATLGTPNVLALDLSLTATGYAAAGRSAVLSPPANLRDVRSMPVRPLPRAPL